MKINKLLLKLLKYFILKRKKINKFYFRGRERILLLPYSKIGDMILFTPLLNSIKKQYPEIKIEILAGKVSVSVLKNNPNIYKIHYLNENSSLISRLSKIIHLRKTKFDLLIDFSRKISLYQYLKILLIDSKIKIGPYKLNYYEKKFNIKSSQLKNYNILSGNRKNKHFSKYFLSLLDKTNIKKPNSINLEFHFDEKNKLKPQKFLSKLKKQLIGINIDGRTLQRTIKSEDIKEILSKLINNNTGYQIVIIYKKVRKKLFTKIKRKYPNKVFLYPKTNSIHEIGYLIKNLSLIITPDTSVVHIASALKTKLLAIYSPNKGNYIRFHPINTTYKIIKGKNKKMNSIQNFDTKELILKANMLLKKDEI